MINKPSSWYKVLSFKFLDVRKSPPPAVCDRSSEPEVYRLQLNFAST
ncbi:MAG: hypothetical protein KME60_13170 [Cyanomargarita calcarea GSE-NOS-MK-12-04C]|uniref:Uncharacterized protein n=1 Tax=Cyanomargarita calcarea GSE-NOS-MK-12-04C TaxID=2839659 RepID=A0A951QMS1_9CYAN|nr:hypothetical protein [Cyanomargarita calcarea GSE-NOS-MK-12-04C]